MKFALAIPGLLNYPASMAPWEPQAGGAEILEGIQCGLAERQDAGFHRQVAVPVTDPADAPAQPRGAQRVATERRGRGA